MIQLFFLASMIGVAAILVYLLWFLDDSYETEYSVINEYMGNSNIQSENVYIRDCNKQSNPNNTSYFETSELENIDNNYCLNIEIRKTEIVYLNNTFSVKTDNRNNIHNSIENNKKNYNKKNYFKKYNIRNKNNLINSNNFFSNSNFNNKISFLDVGTPVNNFVQRENIKDGCA